MATVLALVAALLLGQRPPTAHAASDPAWGVLASGCTTSDIAANRAVGIGLVEVEAYWDRWLPTSAGVENTDYVADLSARVTACLDAGLRVVLGTGTQYPPSWVRGLPGATLVDQRGDSADTGAIDTVFSAAVRSAQDDYLRRIVAALPVARLDGIRVGTSAAGEIGFPGPNESGTGFLQSFWAFGADAQQGTGLAAGMPRTPMPGWVPGTRTWNGTTVTPAAARNWFLWYERSLMYAVKGQADTLRTAGYTGAVHVPAPGKGVLPADLTAATNALLNGTGDRDGSLGRGLYYVDQFPVLAGNVASTVVVDLTGVDDATAVTARALTPAQDTCQANDATTSIQSSTPVASWSNLRFARAQAARAGLAAVGENPGPPAAQTGGTSNSDSEAEQIRRSPAYARGCALAAFFLAFEDVLDDPSSGSDRQDYVDAVTGTS
ncbi:hypothetical protein [Actinomycetospora termitidis]|uniref:Glycoside hydrolase family 42 N-terminal domain-containing protein n=1 Tax=Actinomycetospora termitidis TaxID=3053470 RepID=A0ABT7M4T7_9PSEU|nr:hypothetical protein [Actinomycetospora sp. Odt1-22]MDL5155694.1 hypothetical protein [Actinomycetospora sp. Odt1-22]